MTQENQEQSSQTYIPYVSLHNLSTYSIFGSLLKIEDLFKRAKELNMPAVALCDAGTCAGLFDAYKESKKTGVKLIAGVTLYFVNDVANKEAKMRTIVLIAKNATGYRNLLLLTKKGFDNNIVARRSIYPRIDWNLLEEHKDELICLTGDSSGIIGRLINDKKIDEAEKTAQRLKDIFGDDLALELQPNALRRVLNNFNENTDQIFTNRQLRKIGDKLNIKMVSATESRYLMPDQHDALDTWLAIGSANPKHSNNRLKFNINDYYVKSGDEVKVFFNRIFDEKFVDELIANTLYFADKCEQPDWIEPKYSNSSGNELAEFPVKDQKDYHEFLAWKENYEENTLDDEKLYLRFVCFRNLENLFDNNKLPKTVYDEYKDRLKEELDVLEFHSFSGYMLVVSDYVEYAKNNDISVGPGRGSVGGSLIGYLLKIHIADPIKYDLVFARFHNKSKVSAPDIDLDFCTSKRYLVEQYLIKKYGADRVAHISNFNTLTPKPYVKAISRVFEYGGGRKEAVQVGNVLADTIPSEVKSITAAFEQAPLFAEYAKHYTELKTYAKDLGKNPAAISTHAGGIVVGRRSLFGLVPLRRDKEGTLSLEYEKERAEENGLIKMDILGLSTLDIIDETYRLIEKAGKQIPNFDYETYDEKTYDLISSGNTFCVFQFGTSGGTIDLCKKFQPKSIEDLALITTLARPAAKLIRKDFFDVKNGIKPVTLHHPLLERAFSKTLGFPLYDESLLVLAQDIAKWDLNEGDNLRKLTKLKGKYPAKVKKWKEDFIDNAFDRNNINKEVAQDIWETIIEPFGTYSFNKSHAILYSMISYHTAFLKANFPVEFLVANLKSEVNSNAKISKDNIAKIKTEIKQHNVKILPPDINTSDTTYTLVGENTLRTGLNSLKYIGSDSIPEILARRAEKPFIDFEDFLTRCNSSAVRSNAIQALAASGSLDSFGMTRKQMYLYASDYKKKLQSYLKKKLEKRGEFQYPWPNDEVEWNISEIHALEIYYLNEGLTGSPYDIYYPFFNKKAISFKDFPKLLPPPREDMDEFELKKYNRKVPDIQGIVKNIFEFKIKKIDSKLFGETMAKMTVEDIFGSMVTVTLFPDCLTNFYDRIAERSNNKLKFELGMGIKIIGSLQYYDGNISVIYEKLADCCGAPKIPNKAALSHKKVSMLSKKIEKVDISKTDELDRNDLLDEIEEELSDQGTDLNDDYE